MTSAIRACATVGCTNPGPLEIPIDDPEFYASVADARNDARCGPCVHSIHVQCEGLAGDELHEARFRWLQTYVSELRTQQYPYLLNGRWVYPCCVDGQPTCKHTAPRQR